MRPERGAVVGQREMVLDVPLRAEHQGLRGGARFEVLKVLGGQAVQPGQPVRAGDPHDLAVGAVHQAGRAGQRPLLRMRVPVVGGDPRVDSLRRDRAGPREQRALHASRLCGGQAGYAVGRLCGGSGPAGRRARTA